MIAAGAVVATGVATFWGVTGAQAGQPAPTPGDRLQIFYTAPVLARSGERVLVPVDAMCSTVRGTPCRALVTMRAADGLGPARATSVWASPGLRFDLSAAASQVVTDGAASSFVRFSIEARGAGGRASLPPAGSPLRFYVARSIPPVSVASLPFAHVRRGRTVLSLPWGSGPARAGIALGGGDLPAGPSSFDVDRSGRIFLLDTKQSRLGVFAAGRLVRSTPLPVAPRSDVALSPDGTAFVLARALDGRFDVTPVGPSGDAQSVLAAGVGIPGAIRAVGGSAYVHVFPLDAWLPVAGTQVRVDPGDASVVGEPLPGGRQLLSVVRGRRVRLGTVDDGRVRDAVELVFGRALGELALAAPDRSGGYLAIVHVWRDGPRPADAFQAVQVDGRRIVSTFLLPSRAYTSGSPQTAFRIGPDGGLYQMLTSADGVRVVRYRIGGER